MERTAFCLFCIALFTAVGLSCYDVVDNGASLRDAGAGDGAVADSGHGSGGGDAATTGDSGGKDTGSIDAADDSGGDDSIDAAIPDSGIGSDAGQDAGVDPCLNHCFNGQTDCGETGKDCGGECAACSDPCDGHCSNGQTDCGETGQDCGGACGACPEVCDGHCYNGKADCGESGKDCGGECSACGSGGCSFPQGVPEGDFTPGSDTDGSIGNAVNAVMATLSGCNPGSDCPIGDRYPDGQPWFVDVAAALRTEGYCAGQHELGYTDEIAVSNTGCTGRWFGYHIFNYGGLKVVWSPGAARGWWSIAPLWCN